MTSTKRVLAISTAILLLGSSAAMARGYHYHGGYNRYGGYGYNDNGSDAAAAIGAGILGFGLGALAAGSQNNGYYSPGYAYDPGYAAPAYGYGYGAPVYGYGAPDYGYVNPGYGYAAPAYGYGTPYGYYGAPGIGLNLQF